ncbi:SMI1/KNR4 family protein [Bacteroides sp.]|jgi:hypothetical protein|uniref:SMI1/KNR4 family protein n=1 Tax=Bacteroides sp. TaxID=29523 RepID=UPI0025A5B976|nr:SMI1/KNR4 family protein [Bacteroides sp.]
MCIRTAKKITQTNIEALEKTIKNKLPFEFKNFYLNSNGGVPIKKYFYIEKDDNFVEISFFIPIFYTTSDLGELNIESTYQELIKKNIPNIYLPFAVDWGGNYFALNLETGNVILLLMDLGDFTNKCIKYLSSSFSSFLEKLQNEEDDDSL